MISVGFMIEGFFLIKFMISVGYTILRELELKTFVVNQYLSFYYLELGWDRV